MKKLFNVKTLSLAVLSFVMVQSVNAAALDRSGQDVSAFLQQGTYAEVGYSYINPNISGNDNGVVMGSANDYIRGRATGDIAQSYGTFRYGVKTDIDNVFSVGILYDEPFGAAVEHKGNSNFVTSSADATLNSLTAGRVPSLQAANTPNPQFGGKTLIQVSQEALALKPLLDNNTANPTQRQQYQQATQLLAAVAVAQNANANQGKGTKVNIDSKNITGLVGVKFGDNNAIQVYAGPAVQRVSGEVHLRGTAYKGANGYDATINQSQGYGWVAGAAYSMPEIALRASLTYRSAINHKTTIAENFPALGVAGRGSQAFNVQLPSSYNLDFQTGVNPTTLVNAKIRYVPWAQFKIKPPIYGEATQRVTGNALPIVAYDKNQWSVEVGVGKKISDDLAVLGNIGWDSGVGDPTSTLGPIKDNYSFGLGAKYNVTPEWAVSVGGKYLKFGDATAQLPTKEIAGKFGNNDGFAAGIKLSYQVK